MIINLPDSKARLSELVELASAGEDILITVRGKPKARLTGVVPNADPNLQEWARELTESQCQVTGTFTTSRESILDSTRDERSF